MVVGGRSLVIARVRRRVKLKVRWKLCRRLLTCRVSPISVLKLRRKLRWKACPLRLTPLVVLFSMRWCGRVLTTWRWRLLGPTFCRRRRCRISVNTVYRLFVRLTRRKSGVIAVRMLLFTPANHNSKENCTVNTAPRCTDSCSTYG